MRLDKYSVLLGRGVAVTYWPCLFGKLLHKMFWQKQKHNVTMWEPTAMRERERDEPSGIELSAQPACLLEDSVLGGSRGKR